jgi:uncharacterized protein (TIGR00369 family)
MKDRGVHVAEWLRRNQDKQPANSRLKTYLNNILPYISFVSCNTDPKNPRVVFRFKVQQEHANYLGNMHGGCTATLFDFLTSLSLAMICKPGFWSYYGVSRTLDTMYLRPVPCGETVLVECDITQAGQNLCALRGVIRRERDGTVLATCEHNKVNIDPPELRKASKL